MRWTLLIALVFSSILRAGAQTIPNYRMPLMVSHLRESNKYMIWRPNAPKHKNLDRAICFKKACRSIVGWKRTQQRNKFKGYKTPGIPRLQYLRYDSMRRGEDLPPPVQLDSTGLVTDAPAARDTTIAYVFDDVLFDTNSSDLRSEFTQRLDSLADVIKRYDNYSILIVGHTDNSGSETSNVSLSKDRADAVASHLAGTGIRREVITAEGRGSTSPIGDNRRAEGRRKNRRVEIFLTFH